MKFNEMKLKHLSFLCLLLLSSCGLFDSEEKKSVTPERGSDDFEYANPEDLVRRDLLPVDLTQSLENRSLEEVRLLRNSIFARQGYLFTKAELRGYFTSTTSWYDSLMWQRWELDDQQELENKEAEALDFTKEEQAFLKRCKAREAELLAANYLETPTGEMANIDNVINKFQFTDVSQPFLDKLGENGFAIVPNQNIQLFHLYEQNDYQQVPNFVTTDLFLQLYHMYFSFLLRTLEEQVFMEKVAFISKAMCEASLKDYEETPDSDAVKGYAQFNATFFAVAYKLVGGKSLNLPPEISKTVEVEWKKIMEERDDFSPFMGYENVEFPYSLFKPRGHYSRTDSLKSYFRTMMWLQKAEMCLTDDKSFGQAIYMAEKLDQTKADGKSVSAEFESLYDPIKFIIGEPDNYSIKDIADIIAPGDDPYNDQSREVIRGKLAELNRNQIKPKVQLSCVDKINFMPQRFVLDNEIIEELVDTESDETMRALPKGLDVFGVLGATSAENLLTNFHHEREQWPDYGPRYDSLKQAFSGFDGWDNSVYTKWLECLQVMHHEDAKAPYFMQTEAWDKKELNTALASWAELKHDAILYAEQPFGAECGGGGPPAPITVGYVEPNIAFWKKMIELIDLTENLLKRNDLWLDEIESNSTTISELAEFLLQVSEKEIAGERLTEAEYQTIEVIGSSVEYMTISLLPHWVDNWELVKGPDREVAVVADVYTANSENNRNKSILHVGTGYVNDLYVVVEIEGYLYLTRGAVFSYYEFPEPMGSRLTDEEWQERLKKDKAPPIPEWMKSILFYKKAPKPNEKIIYSSGC